MIQRMCRNLWLSLFLLFLPNWSAAITINPGDYIVADISNSEILKVDPTTLDAEIIFSRGPLVSIFGLGIDALGNIYVGSTSNSTIYKVDPTNGTAEVYVEFATTSIWDIVVLPDGTLYFSARTGGREPGIYQVNASTQEITPIINTGLTDILGFDFLPSTNEFVFVGTGPEGSGVYRFNATDRLLSFIHPTPNGLSVEFLDSNTVIVSINGDGLYEINLTTQELTLITNDPAGWAWSMDLSANETHVITVPFLQNSLNSISLQNGSVENQVLNPQSGILGNIDVRVVDPTDRDGDGVRDEADNCPDTSNPNQEDRDSNGVGDACNDFQDRDGDEWSDSLDNCPDDSNPTQLDTDLDGLGDVCDSFPTDPNNELRQCQADLQTSVDRVTTLEAQVAQACVAMPNLDFCPPVNPINP